jgi:hypothetical protein
MRLRWQGGGDIGGEAWSMTTWGHVVPDWPNGVDHTGAIVGMFVRTGAHSNNATAGMVTSWIAVRG